MTRTSFQENKNCSKLHLVSVLSIFLVFQTVLFSPNLAKAAEEPPVTFAGLPVHAPTATEAYEADTVYMGVWLSNVYGYEYLTGDYTLDFYLYFLWVDGDPNMTQVDWQLVNGYIVNPTAVSVVDTNLTGSVKREVYRVTARLNTPPDAKDFPFEPIQLGLAFDFLTHGYYKKVVWLTGQIGVDSSFQNPGWTTTNVELNSTTQQYPLNVDVPRAAMTLTQQRQRPVASIQLFIPPTIFAVVSVFSFLFGLKDSGAEALRVGLNTSMLVTTLLFNFAVANSIPPSSTITVYGVFILSVLLFMVINLLVTIVGIVTWIRYKNEKQTRQINRWGLVITIGLPVLLFCLMYFLRG